MQPQAINVKSALDSFIDYNSPKLCTFLNHTWKKQQQAITYKQIREAIFAGQLDMGYLAQWQQDYSKFINQAYAPIAQSAVEASAKALEGIIGQGAEAITHKHMGAFIKYQGGKLIREVSEEQYKAVNTLVRQAAMSDTMSARDLAKAIRPTIGLTKRQSQSAYNRYMAAIEDGATPAKAREIQAKYAARLHRQRAETIAITELAHAYNNAECMVVQDAYLFGNIGSANKQWSTAFDERVCPTCGKMDGEKVSLFDPFSSGLFVPPAHPRCRCTVNYVDVTQPDLWVQTPAAPQATLRAAEMTQLEDFKDGPPTGEKLDTLYPVQAPTTVQELIPPEPEDVVVIPDTISIKGLKYDSPANLGGTGEMHILTDSDGEEWLFKPGQSKGGKPEAFRAHIQEAGYKVQGIVDPDSAVKAGTGTANIPGKGEAFGAAQKRITNIDSSFNLHNWQLNGGPLDADTIAQLQRENVTDWLLCNYDSHGRNFVMTKDGKLIGVDKEQAFRYITQDSAQKMSLTYHPNKVYGETEPVYNTLYRRFADGEIDIRLNDTLTYIKRIEAIPDKEYREIFRKYAESLHGPGQQAEDLLDKIVYRKQTVRQAYEEFYSELLTKRKGSPATFTFMDATDAFTLTPKNPATATFTPSALNAMTAKDLKALAKANGVKYHGVMHKSELIAALSDPANAEAVSEAAKLRFQQRAGGATVRQQAATAAETIAATPRAKLGGLQQLSSALDDIDTALEGSTYHGVQLISDASALEGMSTTMRKITIDGTEYYELTGKLTNDRWKQTLQDLSAQSTSGNYWHFNKADWPIDHTNPILALKPETEKFNIGTQYIKDGNDIFIITGESAANNGRALAGQFNLRVQASSGADAARKMRGLLQRAGLQDIMEDATEEALDRYKKMRVIWQTDPKTSYGIDPEHTSPEKLNKILEKLGITQKRLDAIKMKKVTDGYYTFYDPENYKIAQQQKAAYLYHETSSLQRVEEVLTGSGLTSTTTRFNDGITTRGASSTRDIMTGGADGVFTRLVYENQVGKENRYGMFGDYVFVFDTKALERTDWYAYTSDNFGSTQENSFKNRHGTAEHMRETSRLYWKANELVFRKTLPLDTLKEVRVPAKDTQPLIDRLKARGITQINGIPLSKLIKAVSKLV